MILGDTEGAIKDHSVVIEAFTEYTDQQDPSDEGNYGSENLPTETLLKSPTLLNFLRDGEGYTGNSAYREFETHGKLLSFLWLDPPHVSALIERARLFSNNEDISAALADLDLVLGLSLRDAPRSQALFQRFAILHHLGRKEEAYRDAGEAISLGGPISIFLHYPSALAIDQKLDEAIHVLSAGIERFDYAQGLYLLRAVAYRQLGDFSLALNDFNKAKEFGSQLDAIDEEIAETLELISNQD